MKLKENPESHAMRFATRKHGDTGAIRRHTGQPYIVHPEGVVKLAKAYGLDKNQIQAAWLHDTVEDTGTLVSDIAEKFGPDVAELVSELTTDENERKILGKEQALNKELASMSSRALDVKLCDMLYNSKDYPSAAQLSRIKRNIDFLKNRRKLTPVQKELCSMIVESYSRAADKARFFESIV